MEKKVYKFIVPALCAVLSLVLSCAGPRIKPTAEAANVISKMEISESDAATTIMLIGSMSPKFNPFRMTDPLRIVIDIANSDITQLKSSTDVDNGVINNIKTNQMGEETGFLGRIEIGLERSVKYSVNPEGNDIKIEISKVESIPEPVSEVEEGEVEAIPEAVPAPVAAGLPATAEIEAPPAGEMVAEAVPGEELFEEPTPSLEAVPPPAPAPPPVVAEAPPPVVVEAPPPAEAPPPVVSEAPPVEAPMVEEAPPPAPAPEVVEVPPAKEAPPVVAMVTPEPEIEVEERPEVKVVKGKIKPPKPIVFGSNVAQTTPEGEALVKEIANFLRDNPSMKVRIEGYTDNMGDSSFNQAVSEYRAIWVKLLLTNMGIPEGRLEVRGFGSSKPLASNKSETGRIKNRRVEFTVLTQ